MTALNRRSLFTGAVAASAATAITPFAEPTAARRRAAGRQADAGYYRYKVGSIEMTVLTDGGSIAPMADGYISERKRPAVNDALEADYMEKDKVRGSFTPMVVNTGSKLVQSTPATGLATFAHSEGSLGQ